MMGMASHWVANMNAKPKKIKVCEAVARTRAGSLVK